MLLNLKFEEIEENDFDDASPQALLVTTVSISGLTASTYLCVAMCVAMCVLQARVKLQNTFQ
jgi:ABC-type Fe3+ transport system permease subunit